MTQTHRCPACWREFTNVLDYPIVKILSFERLPIPEALDSVSAAAAAKRLDSQRDESSDTSAIMHEGINMTPAVARACETREVRDYLDYLSTLPGHEIAPTRLLPPLATHGYFKWAYVVRDTPIYLSLSDEGAPEDTGGITKVRVHCEGPNLGSAGGPTLQPLGAIARLGYRGLLAEACPHP